jgi:molybdate transport system substrate-binding protein
MRIRVLAAAFRVSSVGRGGGAAELKVFSTIGVQAALEEAHPEIRAGERAQARHHLEHGRGPGEARCRPARTADVVVLTRASLDTLAKEGKAVAEPTFASSGMGMVVKKGARKPDISTPDAFKRALLSAATIAYSDPAHGGASGVYLAKLLERHGHRER